MWWCGKKGWGEAKLQCLQQGHSQVLYKTNTSADTQTDIDIRKVLDEVMVTPS